MTPGVLKRFLEGVTLAVIFLPLLSPSSLQAQDKRAGNTYYVKFGGGLSDYAGGNSGQLALDTTTELAEFFDARKFTDGDVFPYMLAGEVGYQFSPAVGIGLGYQFGQYPFASGVPFTTIPGTVGRGGDHGTARHTVQLLGRYMIRATDWTVSPYLDTGMNVSFGGFSAGVGPLLGAGMDVSLTGKTSLFVEGRVNITLPDEATDGIDSGDPFDALSALPSIGLKYTLEAPPVAPRILALNGPAELTVGESAGFAARMNEDATRPLTYEWSFGDGRTAAGLTTSHVYNQPGTYTVAFVARNEAGAARDSLTVTVNATPRPPRILSLDATPNPASTGELVRFDSDVEGAEPLTLEWNFGDGDSEAGPSPTHAYDNPGEYTVRLITRNQDGEARDSLTMEVEQTLPDICETVQELNSVYFAQRSSRLTSDARQKLRDNTEVLRNCPNLSVRVEGFASPTEPTPQSLSEERAQAVAAFYEDEDIGPERIATSGEGAVGDTVGKKGANEQSRRADSIPQRTGNE